MSVRSAQRRSQPGEVQVAEALVREWLGEAASIHPLTHAMNSAAWMVVARSERYVLKLASPATWPGLRVAACLEQQGFPTGAPLRMARRGRRLAALLRFVDGSPLTDGDVERIGTTLGHVHQLLRACSMPRRISRWPWEWLNPREIEDRALGSAAAAAIDRAHALAPMLTHGVVHGDPAPEAFRATGEEIALIDWGAASHGPLLYDVASAWMYTDARVIEAYGRAGLLAPEELARAPELLAFRWAVQAWYFSVRLARGDLTGLTSAAENAKGLDDAREALLGSRRPTD